MIARNAIANFLGNLAAPLVGLLMTPFYLRKIGLEGLGLIGFVTLLTTMLGVFVAGVSKTYQRDVSAAQIGARRDLRGLVKGGLGLFGATGLVLGLGVFLAGAYSADGLARTAHVTSDILLRSLVVISLHMAIGVTIGGVTATMFALRDQVWPNTLSVLVGIFTACLTWMALEKWPRVDVFYTCQLAGAAVLLVVTSLRCGQLLNFITANVVSRTVREAWREKLHGSGKLSLKLMIQEAIGVCITQIDRLLLTNYMPLAALGSYNLSANPSRFTTAFTNPINTVTYPELCRLSHDGKGREVAGEYLGRITFLLILLCASAMIVFIPAGGDLLALWLGAQNVPEKAPICLILLSAGHLVLAAAGPAYNLTVAYGQVNYGIINNVIMVSLLPFLGWGFLQCWGVAGAAALWLFYAMESFVVCSCIAYTRHADPGSGMVWIWNSLRCLAAAGLFCMVLSSVHLSNLTMICTSVLASTAFAFMALRLAFGPVGNNWLAALEVRFSVKP